MKAILRKGDAGHIALMSPEAAEFPPGLAVPEADRVIGTAGEDASAVDYDRDGSNCPVVALEGAPGSPVGYPMRTDFTELEWKKGREDLIPRRVVACNAVSESGASR